MAPEGKNRVRGKKPFWYLQAMRKPIHLWDSKGRVSQVLLNAVLCDPYAKSTCNSPREKMCICTLSFQRSSRTPSHGEGFVYRHPINENRIVANSFRTAKLNFDSPSEKIILIASIPLSVKGISEAEEALKRLSRRILCDHGILIPRDVCHHLMPFHFAKA